MQFNSDQKKQAQEVYFSKKLDSDNSFPVTFNNTNVTACSSLKHLRMLNQQTATLQRKYPKVKRLYVTRWRVLLKS